MVEIKQVPVITCGDVQKLTGKYWAHFEFAQMAEDDSYQTLYCSDEALEELEREIEWESRKWGQLTVADFEDEEEYERHLRTRPDTRLLNQLDLIKILRDQYNITNRILIHVVY